MLLEEQLDIMEEYPQTEAEWIDQESEISDYASWMDEYLGPDAMESDMENAWDAFITKNESDYWGYSPSEIIDEMEYEDTERAWNSGGYHIVESAYAL